MSYGYLWPLIQLKAVYWAYLLKNKILLGRQYLPQNIHFTSCKACKKSNTSWFIAASSTDYSVLLQHHSLPGHVMKADGNCPTLPTISVGYHYYLPPHLRTLSVLQSRDNVVRRVTRLWARQSGFWTPVRARYLSLLQNVQTGCGAHTASNSMGTMNSSAGGKLARAWGWPIPST